MQNEGCPHGVTEPDTAGWWAVAEERDAEVGVCCCCGGPSPVRAPLGVYRLMPYCGRCDEGVKDYEAQARRAA